jgi:cyanophycinase
MTAASPGPLAFVGGGEWQPECRFDADLLARSGADEVVVLPTGAAYEHPDRLIEAATRYFSSLGATVTGLPVLARPDADKDEYVAAVRDARFVYLCGGSPLHLRSVLKDSKVWQGLEAAWHAGAVIAGSSAGAMVLGDPMVDPRGGAFTIGLGLVERLAVLPHANTWSPDKAHRTLTLASGGVRVAAIDEQTALIRDPDGTWQIQGQGRVTVYMDGSPAELGSLAD